MAIREPAISYRLAKIFNVIGINIRLAFVLEQ